MVIDVHTYARPDDARVTHLDLDLTVDFESRAISGTARLTIETAPDAKELVLDTNALTIRSAHWVDGPDAQFELGPVDQHLGQPLTVALTGHDVLEVHYSSAPSAASLLWLDGEHTESGRPIMFTQGQPILTRSWIPLQDSPQVRFTYSASVRVPDGNVALMSATRPTLKDGAYEFAMTQPVPAYLIALAVGPFEFRSTGPRTGVYAEPSLVDAAAWEFANGEEQIQAAEALYGPYRWDIYDLLVVPPMFAFGGMENPRLTFMHASTVTGDRSQIETLAHELAHSWSGNLVTNATWGDMWLNEGFTTYFENRLVEALYGRDASDMAWALNIDSVQEMATELAPAAQILHRRDLAGRDPDDGWSQIPYDKGALLLLTIETAVGRSAFDVFLRGYFDAHAFRSIDTESFVAYLTEHLLEPHGLTADDVSLDEWINRPGLPGNVPDVLAAGFAAVDVVLARLAAGDSVDDAVTGADPAAWLTPQWARFLRSLPTDLDLARLERLDVLFGLTATGNSEIRSNWLVLVVRSGHGVEVPAWREAVSTLVHRYGRRKYITPLYAALAQKPEGLAYAREIYSTARAGYHSSAQREIDGLLGIAQG
ncbi:aminopeptidase [Nocardioides baekrokdamisoli]|uniref:Aminopeptidase N n=1 Tax=Nocardioides baekrokdamisoli TaxID=1804624 RepID=A0A3G9J3M7_9ACTN|nr:M1 family metallopeptidase [Nocardioides baekrokdamisoli]BBH18034.1 aminopeptidase [Nocardioides baekrokdamisoli]